MNLKFLIPLAIHTAAVDTLWLAFNNPFVAITVELLGGWIILRYFVPKSTAEGAIEIVKRLKKDPEIKPIIDGAKELLDKAKPFVVSLQEIKPEDISALVKALKTFTSIVEQGQLADLMKQLGTVAKNVEKPAVIPEPSGKDKNRKHV